MISSTSVPNSVHSLWTSSVVAHTPNSKDFFCHFSKGCKDQPLWPALCCFVGRQDPEPQIKQTNETTLGLAQHQFLTLYILYGLLPLLPILQTSSVISQKAAKTNNCGRPYAVLWVGKILNLR